MGDEEGEEDRPIELAFLVQSTCDRAYAPALSTRCAPRRRSGRGRKASSALGIKRQIFTTSMAVMQLVGVDNECTPAG
jgi:hypothetical protein